MSTSSLRCSPSAQIGNSQHQVMSIAGTDCSRSVAIRRVIPCSLTVPLSSPQCLHSALSTIYQEGAMKLVLCGSFNGHRPIHHGRVVAIGLTDDGCQRGKEATRSASRDGTTQLNPSSPGSRSILSSMSTFSSCWSPDPSFVIGHVTVIVTSLLQRRRSALSTIYHQGDLFGAEHRGTASPRPIHHGSCRWSLTQMMVVGEGRKQPGRQHNTAQHGTTRFRSVLPWVSWDCLCLHSISSWQSWNSGVK